MTLTRPAPTRLAATTALAVLAACAFGLAPGTAAAALGTGVVDVTTNLAYQNASAAGTGIVLTASGEVLTNNHVIRGATTIRVVDPATRRSYAAAVVGYSVANDVAVLQVTAPSHLHTVALGNSATVRAGQRVTAVGNAGGVGGPPSSARGKVTSIGRSIVASDGQGISEQLTGLIQIDAALRPGDSGGPLLNANGRVVGMDTAASVSFAFQSAGEAYAIPINRALALAKQMEAGRASATVHIGTTPFLGVNVAPASGNVSGGALIVGVVPGAPADLAGLVAGDTITALDGQPVATYDQLGAALLQTTAGATVTLSWIDQTGTTQSADVQTIVGPPQ
ncbi:MAG TPA: trypsin-like peptidase domain-containing protein [Gaiellaceae bacterium]|nr:trypsin-like peptidase domain-containing protein [Gaiellaceae bacterium]